MPWSSASRCATRCSATGVADLELLPGSRSFQDVDALARSDESQAALLRQHLHGELEGYDYVLIDCPPSLGTLTQTALSASTEVLMPIQCEYFAMEGLTQMIQVIKGVMQRFPGRLEFGGILLTMYDAGLELTHEVDAEVRDFFGEIVFADGDPPRCRRGRGPEPRAVRNGLRPALARRASLYRTVHGGAGA